MILHRMAKVSTSLFIFMISNRMGHYKVICEKIKSAIMLRFVVLLAVMPFLGMCSSVGQKRDLTVTVRNQPDHEIVLGRIRGDRFIPVDSLQPDHFKRSGKETTFSFDLAEEHPPGMYRIVLGHSAYSRNMNETPMQIDFIHNREEVVLFTDFISPDDSLKVIRSDENQIWLGFKRKEKEYQHRLRELVMELDYGHAHGGPPEKIVEEFNQLQREREQFILESSGRDTGMVSCRLIALYREPFLDASLPPDQRRDILRRDYFSQPRLYRREVDQHSGIHGKGFQIPAQPCSKGTFRGGPGAGVQKGGGHDHCRYKQERESI